MADAPGVSGPGALARRTDKGPAQKLRDLPNANYGENATYKDLQQGAPLAQVPAGASPEMTGDDAPEPTQVPVGLDAPSQRPDEPVTAGASSGPGPNTMQLPDNGAAGYQTGVSLLQQLQAMNPDNTEVATLLQQIQAGGM